MELSSSVFVVVADALAAKSPVGFLNWRFNGDGLFSLIRLRGNCIVGVSSFVVVDAFDGELELPLTTIDGIEIVVEWELFCDDESSFDDSPNV